MGITERSIYRWLQDAKSPDGLAAKPHPGTPTRLSVAQQKELEQLLLQGAQAHGWPNQLWTTQRIADLIRRKFGVSLHHDHVGRFLRERLESGFMLTPTVRRTWAPQGQTPLLSSWDRRDRLSAISCVTVSPRRARHNFYFTLLPDNTNAKAPDIVDFLRSLKHQLGSPLTVIWDGSKIHSRSKLVKQYLAKHPEIVAETLPGYAPELNPDEGVWGWTKYGRLANLAASNTLELRRRIQDEFAVLRDDRQLLNSFVQEADLCCAA